MPQAALLSMLILDQDEIAWVNSEDLESCFNLFFLPDCWRGYFAFSKTVVGTALGLDSADPVYVGMRMVPMGWVNSVDIIQNFIRRFVFKTLGVDPASEVQRAVPIPRGDAAVVCMDGFDLISRASIEVQLHDQVKVFSLIVFSASDWFSRVSLLPGFPTFSVSFGSVVLQRPGVALWFTRLGWLGRCVGVRSLVSGDFGFLFFLRRREVPYYGKFCSSMFSAGATP